MDHVQTPEGRTQTIVTGGLRRPSWICRNVRQVCVLVRDGSPSMIGKKAREASKASLDLVAELAQPENKDGFSIGVVDFAGSSKVVHRVERATTLHGRVKRLSVRWFGLGGTNITAGLKDALSILDAAEAKAGDGASYLRPVVIIFTDGWHNTGPSPRGVATEVKENADLVTVAFGSDADEALLRELASTPQHSYRCKDGRQLRSFLAAVGATMTATMAAGTSATQALTQLQQ